MEILKTHVKSTAVEAIGYDNANKVLRVWLLTGRVYDYFKVPKSAFTSFLTASSKGIYYNTVIKKLYKKYQEVTAVS